MDKMAQQEDNPLLTTPIKSENLVMGVWNKYFADKHSKIIANLRAAFQQDPQLKADLEKTFTGYAWPEFADMPTNSSLQQLAATVSGLRDNPRIQMNVEAYNALQLYMDQYNLMLQKMSEQNKVNKEPAKAKKPAAQSPKVKQLQQLLGVNPTGMWDTQSNTAFLTWLKANGWDKYISGDKFTGKIDDAIRAMLIEKAAPAPAQQAGAEPNLQQRQSARAELLKKIGG